MLQIRYSAQFKKDYKRVKKQGHDMAKLVSALELLARGDALPERMHDHALSGSYKSFRECHIEPDWLLIYKIDSEKLTLTATRTGSHATLLSL